MKKSMWRFVLCLAVLLLMIIGQVTVFGAKATELRFLTFQVGVHPEAGWLDATVKSFNAKYAGKIKVVTDGVGTDTDCFNKLRTDAATNTMPDLFMLKSDRSEFNVLAQSGRVVDLTRYLRADKKFWARIDEDSAANYTDNGKLLGLPYVKALVGIYWNKDLFSKAGVKSFPATWDEFMAACEKIKASGATPLSLMTGENSWTTALLLADMLGTSAEGNKWLKGKPAEAKFNVPVFIDAVKKLQICLAKYTTPDAFGSGYGTVVNYFFQSKTAMVANGPWMIGSLRDPAICPKATADNIGYALAPGGGVIAMENVSYATGSKGSAKINASVTFLKFLATPEVYSTYLSLGGAAPCVSTDMTNVKYDSINNELINASAKAKFKYSIFPNAVKPAVIDALSQFLPSLADGSLTPEQFAQKLQETSDKN